VRVAASLLVCGVAPTIAVSSLTDTKVNSPGRWTFDHHLEEAGIVIIP
jgi:hypothetical protein